MKVRDAYLISRMGKCTESLGDASVLSTLDVSSEYWKILTVPNDCNRTRFSTHFETCTFTPVRFG